ncbi:helix-turn-helix domain-containing protein [Xanthocytophaga agilis]|uniref:Helix-turn-helix domain-containing protein n=1 Tax=Xanthocytophaga agilis TaxID=3048010 RepID=A0AAE3UCW3_9BACT|nr:helix-turn-helix domain-containing protein [Xanthocytophaga agilis]MDJ1499726.1 helix-turn-helix domain-containing protein [Xanthocytophaga agilis]
MFFSKDENKLKSKALGMFIAVLVYNGFETFNWSSGINSYFFALFPFTLIFALGPSLYLYVYAIVHPQQKTPQSIVWYYAPVLVQFVIRCFLILYFILEKTQLIHSSIFTQKIDYWQAVIAEPLSVLIFWLYLLYSVKLIRQQDSSDRLSKFRWIKILIIAMLILGIVWVVTVISPFVWPTFNENHYYPSEVLLVILIYWISFAGYHRTKIVYLETVKAGSSSLDTLTPDEIAVCVQKMQEAMESEKLYLDPDLTVAKLADHISLNSRQVSSILNQHLQKGFSEFVNEYRVNEVKQRLLASENQHMTISGIALDCGFSSQATFQRVFKLMTQMTPKEFIQSEIRKVKN